MSVTISKPAPAAPGRPVWPRLAGLLLLLLVEGLVFGIVFDAESLRQLPVGWWSSLQPVFAPLLRITSVIGAAALLLGGYRIPHVLESWRDSIATHSIWPGAALHLLCVLILFAVSGQLFGVIATQTRHPGQWMVVWFAACLACGITWLLAALPVRLTVRFLLAGGGVLALGVLVGLLAWVAGQYTQRLWTPLRLSTLYGAYAMLRVFEPAAYVNAARFTIGARHFAVEINPQCSGYEGIGLGWVFLLAYGWFFRSHLRFPQAFLLLPLLTLASWAANVVRIAVLVLIGARVSPWVALGSFHSYAGLILFLGVALGTVYLADGSAFFARREAEPDRAKINPASPFLLPLLAAVAVSLVTESLPHRGLDPLYALRILAAGAVLLYYRESYANWVFSFSWSWILIGGGIFVVWLLLSRSVPSATPPFAAGGWPWLQWLAIRIFGSVLIVPIIEELAFRGYLARRLMSVDFASVRLESLSVFAIFTSGLLFGLLHSHLIAGSLAGIGYALVARFRGRITDTIAAHMLTNALLAAYILWTHQWGLWA